MSLLKHTSRDFVVSDFFDVQKHIMFLLFLEVTVATLRDFRAMIFENVNTSRLLLQLLGVTPG